MRTFDRFAFLLALVLLPAAIGPAATAAEPEISLRWALGAWTGDGPPDPVQRDTALEPGTRLKFLVEPTSPSTVYLLLLDTEQEIHVLYRETSTLQTDAQGRPTYIPPGSQYFELDDAAGVDTFFLLASAEPLAELDDLLERYAGAVGADGRAGLRDGIIAEIRKQHRAHRDFSRPVEKPVLIGGQTRGEETLADSIDRLAVEVTGAAFFSKTITIEKR